MHTTSLDLFLFFSFFQALCLRPPSFWFHIPHQFSVSKVDTQPTSLKHTHGIERANMASEQVSRRRENTTSDREIHVETDKVPKMTIHFESLSEKAQASDPNNGKSETQSRDESLEREGHETARQTEATGRQDREGKGEEKESRSDKQLEYLAEKVKTIDVGGQKGGYEGGEREGHGARGESLAEKVEKIEIGGAPMKGVSRGGEGEKERDKAGQEGRQRSESGRQHHEEGRRRTESKTSQVEEKGGQMIGETAIGKARLFLFF